MSQALPTELIEAARRGQRDERLAETLARHCPDLQAEALDTGIHPECQMLAHSLRAHGDADRALSQYFAVALQQYQVVRQLTERLFERPADIDFLDFACGYGRLLRFLVHRLPAGRIHAAEIQTDAVDWVRERYGVDALRSTAAPEDFDPGRRFDMIWAASLFSHLPDGLFGRWLARLAGLLETGGALCFSVHDEVLLPGEITMPANGLRYLAGSENADLDPAIYGTTFVTQAYVEHVVREQLGADVALERLPRLLAHEQDVYVLTVPARDLSSLDGFRRGTRGWLDALRLDPAAGTVELVGWAGSLDATAFDHVEIRLGERLIRQPVGDPTPQVAEVLGHPGLAESGFSCTLELPGTPAPWLSLSAVAADGERALIYCGRLGAGAG
ncbi:MAG: methyltransferase domain-containing protein [Alphaproteobacteria bacterium]|jgi:SAM-dependent methyltransferase|nr:methyltransferase domain-containing protein [Alphaproteobacteria bacterium]